MQLENGNVIHLNIMSVCMFSHLYYLMMIYIFISTNLNSNPISEKKSFIWFLCVDYFCSRKQWIAADRVRIPHEHGTAILRLLTQQVNHLATPPINMLWCLLGRMPSIEMSVKLLNTWYQDIIVSLLNGI